MTSPVVTVVIPTHNRRRLLAMTLGGVLSQKGVDFDVVVVDDHSTDDTPAFLEQVGDKRVRVIRNRPGRGVSGARNRGIEDARGEWIAFCDDDDLWAPDKLSAQLGAANEKARLWVYTGSVNINARNEVVAANRAPTPEEVLARIGESNVIPGGCSGVIVAQGLLARVGNFDVRLSPMADWDLWLRLSRYAIPAVVDRPLVAYRIHDDNLSLDRERMEIEFKEMKRRNPMADPGIFYRYIGWWCMRVGRRREAARLFLSAARARSFHYPLRQVVADLAYVAGAIAVSKGLTVRRGKARQKDLGWDDVWVKDAAAWVSNLIRTEADH